jgi:hypothetical protein
MLKLLGYGKEDLRGNKFLYDGPFFGFGKLNTSLVNFYVDWFFLLYDGITMCLSSKFARTLPLVWRIKLNIFQNKGTFGNDENF